MRMRKLVNNWSFSVVVLFLFIKFLQLLRKLGLKAKEDGWRKITQVYLRTEQSKFSLACFGLGLSSREAVLRALDEFFREHAVTHWQVAWGITCARREKKDNIDIVEAEFAADGDLKRILPLFGSREDLNGLFVQAYNLTRLLCDKKRPLALEDRLFRLLTKHYHGDQLNLACDYLDKILSGAFVSFEASGQGKDFDRFSPPDFVRRKHPGYGVFNIVCRLDPSTGEADLWFQCHHTCIDGLPLQEALQDLKTKWGKDKEVAFPANCEKNIIPQLCSDKEGKGSVYCLSERIDFHSFIDSAHKANHEHIAHEKKCITTFRLLLWKLGNHPAFRGKKFLVPVNLPERNGKERSLGFVLIRPGLFFDERNPEKAFLKFQEEFDRQVKSTIFRRSENYDLFETYACLPPFLFTLVSAIMGPAVREFAGSIGVSILSKADFFVAPSSDIHTDGFIAIGNFLKPTEDNKIACPVTIKGPKDKVKLYMTAIEEIANAK